MSNPPESVGALLSLSPCKGLASLKFGSSLVHGLIPFLISCLTDNQSLSSVSAQLLSRDLPPTVPDGSQQPLPKPPASAPRVSSAAQQPLPCVTCFQKLHNVPSAYFGSSLSSSKENFTPPDCFGNTSAGHNNPSASAASLAHTGRIILRWRASYSFWSNESIQPNKNKPLNQLGDLPDKIIIHAEGGVAESKQ